ncbi:MAG: transposase [Planctomycetes bacterium]|nr:transposase [Planctomycetota bacterium]MBU1517428.1 transposase [Planctomycetota bacterium]MBU2457787.1 transposase [Planctomycetota bacterium]MBU2597053.1 transposase [Planctomycetota bacterium]
MQWVKLLSRTIAAAATWTSVAAASRITAALHNTCLAPRRTRGLWSGLDTQFFNSSNVNRYMSACQPVLIAATLRILPVILAKSTFFRDFSKKLSLPDKKFLRDALIAYLRASNPIVCQMARHLTNQRTKFISRLDRLDQQLVKDSKFDSTVKEVLPEVRLPGRDEKLTLVVSRLAGVDKPMMLLTNLPVENLRDAKRVLRFYIRRWECEERIRFLKSQVNLEKIRTFRWSAIRRLVLLAVLVTIYLGWLVEKHPNICDRLVYLSQPLPDKPAFLLYRLSGGLTEVINTCFWLHKDLPRRRL